MSVRPSAVEGLLEHVERGLGVGGEQALRQPAAEGRAGLGVAASPGVAVQDHAHDVARVARVELVLVGGRDDVVGRGQDLGSSASGTR